MSFRPRRTRRQAARPVRSSRIPGGCPHGSTRQVQLVFTPPRRLSVSGSSAFLGSSLLAAGLAGGYMPPAPSQVWPLVALSIASMAYDLSVRALQRAEYQSTT
jgi:hypothetical protein